MTTGRRKDPPGPPKEAPATDPQELVTASELFGDLVDAPADTAPVETPAARQEPIKVQLREPGSAHKPRPAPDQALPDEMSALLSAFDEPPVAPSVAPPPTPPAPPKAATPAQAPPAAARPPAAPPRPPAAQPPAAAPVRPAAPAPQPPTAPPAPVGAAAPTFDATDLLDSLFGEPEPPPAAPTAPAPAPATAPPPAPPPPARAARPPTPEVDRMLAGVLGSVERPTSRTAMKFAVAAPAAAPGADGGLDLFSLASDAFGGSPASGAPATAPAPAPASAPAAASARPAVPVDPTASASAFGPYVLLGKIAMGGMAEVFLAKRPGVEGFEKVLAIKRILPHLSDNQEFVSMFVDEAKMVAGLTHPNIVQIFELGKLERSYFIAMEYVHGRDLRTIQKRARERETPFPVGLAMLITSRVAAALEFAHRKKDEKGQPLQIVHRDISPQNILISFEGDVKLTDFGIAKAAAKASTTDRGALRGKLLYMSPEQAWGKVVDRRSDVFSLGVVFYELLAGRKPWAAAQDVSVLEMVRTSAITPLRDVNPKVPPSLAAVAMKALERDHERRYQDAGELLQDLERTLRNVPVTSADLARFLRQLFDEQERGEPEASAADAPAAAHGAVEFDTNPTGNQGPRDEDRTAPSVPRDPAAIQKFLKNFGIK